LSHRQFFIFAAVLSERPALNASANEARLNAFP
jgi:hypothetical protein